jgi:hypothetical protein
MIFEQASVNILNIRHPMNLFFLKKKLLYMLSIQGHSIDAQKLVPQTSTKVVVHSCHSSFLPVAK